MCRSLALLMAVALAGCKRLPTGAVEHFGAQYPCPSDAITALAREDLHYGDLLLARQPPETPAAEVRADPARLAEWTARQRELREELRSSLNRLEMFEVTGCQHRALLGCGHPGNGRGGPDLLSVSCWEIPPDGGAAPAHPSAAPAPR